MCFAPQRRALFRHLNFQSGPELVCFVHVHFDMCLAPQWSCTVSTSQLPKVVRSWCVLYIYIILRNMLPPQRRALFRHLNFQKWSYPGVFCAFWVGNVLRARPACNFSSLIWPDGSAPAALASLFNFDPPGPQIIGKNTVFRDFPTCSRICTCFLLTLSLLCFSLLLLVFSSLCLFPSLLFVCPYCRKFDF